jgi:hypothetical protein
MVMELARMRRDKYPDHSISGIVRPSGFAASVALEIFIVRKMKREKNRGFDTSPSGGHDEPPLVPDWTVNPLINERGDG